MRVKLGLRIAAAGRSVLLPARAAVIIGTAVIAASAGSTLGIIHEWFLFFGFCGLCLHLGCGCSLFFRFCVFCFGLCGLRLLCGRLFCRFSGGCLGLFAAHRRLRAHRRGHAVPRVAAHHGNFAAVQLFDACQILLLLRCTEADRRTVGTGAGRAADAVHVSLRYLGQVVVEHMGQLADIDAAGGDIGGYQHLGLTGLEVFQRGHAGGLALVAMDGRRRDALLGEVFCNFIRAVLGAAEHQRVHHRGLQVLDEPRQQEFLVALFHMVQALLDAVHGAGHRVHLDEGGLAQDACGQLFDLGGHGGAEHQVLTLPGQLCDHLLHIVHKAHIQHPVGFVQHKDLKVREIDKSLTDQVVEPSRAGDQDVHALFQRFHLRCLAHAAKNDGAAQLEILAVGIKAFADLQSKLTGRGQDQGADGTLSAGRIGREPVQHGQRKSSRLAGTGLGAAHQIPAGQHRRDRRRLNGRRGLIACLLHSAQKRGGQIQFFKCHGSPIIIP